MVPFAALGRPRGLNTQGRITGASARWILVWPQVLATMTDFSSLVNTYLNCWLRGSILPWAASISGHAKSGQSKQAWDLYERMQKSGIAPDNRVFVAVLKACASEGELTRGKMVHAHVLECGLESNVFVGNTLIHMYAKCGRLEDARRVFDGLSARDLVSWNAIIAGYVQLGSGQEALQLFRRMQDEGMHPDKVTFLSALKACSNMDEARQVHTKLSECGFDLELRVANTLINMYARCGSLDEARGVFDKLSTRDAVSWNAMIAAYVTTEHAGDALQTFWQMQQVGWDADRVTLISSLKACSSLQALDEGYAQEGNYEASIQLYEKMQVEGLRADEVTVVSILKACSTAGALDQGKLIHAHVEKSGLDSDVFISCTLIDMYVSCGCLVDARLVFDRSANRNLVSWNTMIAGHAQDGDGEKAIDLYKEMQSEGIHPDQSTLTSVLKACCSISALAQGRLIHSIIVDSNCCSDVFLGSTLIDMYCKCGSLVDARRVFDTLPARNLVTWNTMMSGYAQHGCAQEALFLFREMQQEAIHPSEVTFICLLSACSHAGAVDQGIELFQSMWKDFSIHPEMDHLACLVDLLGRAGYLAEAENVISNMPLQPDTTVWLSMLGACQTHGMIEIGRRCFQSVLELDPTIGSAYVTMSNIYAAGHVWEGRAAIRREMQGAGVRRDPGCTWLEVQNKVHSFVAKGHDHLETDLVYAMLRRVAEKGIWQVRMRE